MKERKKKERKKERKNKRKFLLYLKQMVSNHFLGRKVHQIVTVVTNGFYEFGTFLK